MARSSFNLASRVFYDSARRLAYMTRHLPWPQHGYSGAGDAGQDRLRVCSKRPRPKRGKAQGVSAIARPANAAAGSTWSPGAVLRSSRRSDKSGAVTNRARLDGSLPRKYLAGGVRERVTAGAEPILDLSGEAE